MSEGGKTLFQRIEEVNHRWLKNADWYTNGLPGAREQLGPWFIEYHAIEYARSFHRTTIGEDHTYFVLDIDMEILEGQSEYPTIHDDPLLLRAAKLHVALSWTRQWLDEHPELNFFARISGSGIHLVQRLEERTDPIRFLPVIFQFFPKDPNAPDFPPIELPAESPPTEYEGWHKGYRWDGDKNKWRLMGSAWSKVVHMDGYKARISIDLGMFISGYKMIRWTYSRNMKIPHRWNYAIPIDNWDTDWILEHMTREGLERQHPHAYEIPAFQFEQLMTPEDQVHVVKGYQEDSGMRSIHYVINVPPYPHELTEAQEYKIDEMESLLLADETIVPPCVSRWYQRSKSEAGIFWGRLPWIRWLAAQGYTPEDIGLLVRFRVNSEKDNLPDNQSKLYLYTPWAYGPRDNPFKIPSCDKLRDPITRWYVATNEMCEICGRNYPTHKYGDTISIATGKADVGFQRIQEMIVEILDSYAPNNIVIKKATRAGVTTTMIPIAKLLSKKILVVVPTNRIGTETFVKAVKIAHEKFGVSVNAGMFAANKNSCLILTFLNKELKRKKDKDPAWGDAPLSWLSLRYHSKPPCKKCRFRTEELPIPLLHNDVPRPIISSQVVKYSDNPKQRQGLCAFTTLYNQIQSLDVVFITYAKLFAIMANFTDESLQLQQALFDCFDILLLDEISHLTDSSPLNIKILRSESDVAELTSDTAHLFYRDNVFFQLQTEMDKLITYFMATKESGVTRKIEDLIQAFIEQYEQMMLRPMTEQQTRVIPNFLARDEIDDLNETFGKFHSMIEKAAIEFNIPVNTVEAVLILLKEDFWIMTSIPTKFHPVDISFVIKPATSEVKRFVRMFDDSHDKQVIVTDATLPYIGMTDFFKFQFKEYSVGDPRMTNASQLVITDSRNINVIDLFFNKENSERYQSELVSFINMVADTHNPDDMIIVAPNKRTAFWLYGQKKNKVIPNIELTWYRSDATIGVECDKRVMITVCSPHPPRGSRDWLAYYFQQDGIGLDMSIEDLGKKLCDTSTKISFYQTIGRSKDPEVKVRSVVYCWGISGGRTSLDSPRMTTVMDLMTFDDNVPTPQIFKATYTIARTEFITKVGKIWMDDGIRINEFVGRVASITKEQGQLTQRELRRKLNITVRDLDWFLEQNGPAILGKMGITVETMKPPRGVMTRRFRYDENISVRTIQPENR